MSLAHSFHSAICTHTDSQQGLVAKCQRINQRTRNLAAELNAASSPMPCGSQAQPELRRVSDSCLALVAPLSDVALLLSPVHRASVMDLGAPAFGVAAAATAAASRGAAGDVRGPRRRGGGAALARRVRAALRAGAPRLRHTGPPPGASASGGRRIRMAAGGAGGVAAGAASGASGAAAGMPGEGKVRVLMLISDTGGGHRASAQALKAAFEELYPGCVDARIVDFWTETVGRPFDKLPEGYAVVAKFPQLWRCAWNYGRFPVTRRLTDEVTNLVGNRNFRNALADFDPHVVVSAHPLTQHIPLRVLRTLDRKIPFVTVCTDLGGAHPTWFHPDADMTFVPTDLVRDIAMRCGVPPSRLRQYGLAVRPAFWHEDRPKNEVKVDLGLDPDVPTVLVVGGGDGVGGVAGIARAIATAAGRARKNAPASPGPPGVSQEAPPAQIVVVCGKNKRLQADLAATNFPVPVHVQGFVANMSEWMAASDVLVSKAGPGTIAEALIRGLPIVLSGFLPGQEAPNVQYVTDADVGAFSRDPAVIADTVLEWLSEPEALSARSRRAQKLGRPNATYEIVREIATLAPSLSGASQTLPVDEGTRPGFASR